MNYAYLKLFITAGIALVANIAQAQRDTTLNQANQSGTFVAPHSIVLAPGFSSFGPFRAYIDPSLAQCVALNTSLSNNQNYVATYVPRVEGITNPADPNNLTCQVAATIQYFDGLGRPLQTVQVKASPTFRDVVQPMAYDQFGREATKYLPYTATTANSNGSYKASAISDQSSFYTNPATTWNAPGVPKIPFPTLEAAFEPSPLDRVVEEGAPGDNWQLTGKAGTTNAGHTVKSDYATNDAADLSSGTGRWAKLYSVNLDANGKPTLVDGGAYGANQLYVTITKNENWKTTDGKAGTLEEYVDKQNKTVLRRSFNTNGEIASTYFVYNDFGSLSYVLPPKAEPDNGAITLSTLNSLCYQYRYDGRNRLVEKKLPGRGVEYLVYNKLDLVVASQDSMQRVNNNWLFTKFDALSRPVIMGLWNNGGSPISRLALKGQIDVLSILWETKDNSNAAGQYYTQATYPTSNITTYLTVNYYDDYNIPNLPTAYDVRSSYSQMTRSLLTAKRTNILGTSNMLWTVQYYDDKGRAVKAIEQHNLGGGSTLNTANYDEVATAFNFTNQVVTTNRNHHTALNPIVAVQDSFVYDHNGRNTESWKQINGATKVLLSKVDYNEVGQVKTKHLHSTNNGASFLQDINYTYNERGWVKKDSSALFVMQLNYNDGTNPQFNGNIADQYWGTGSSLSKSYTYNYDKLNRLLYGTSSEGFTEKDILYDKAGNFQSMTRIDPRTSSTKNLTYSYNGNQLITFGGMTTSGNYAYDGNGSASFDALNNVNITYNVLNLPQNITGGKTVTYTYNAEGKKMRRVSSTVGSDDYINNIQYHDGIIDFIMTAEGKARRNTSDGSYSYEYSLSDHLGNTRVSFDDSSHVARVIQKDDYYPFGLGYNRYTFGTSNKYLYNNKELQEDLGQYDFGARFYDPTIARWLAYDPLAEKSRRWTPYAYGFNNPLFFTDPDGMDGIASISNAAGTKKDPKVVTVSANYYYASATKVQEGIMADVKSDLASEKTVQGSDGTFYKVKIEVNFIKSDDPNASAQKDVGVNGGSYGNTLAIKNSDGTQVEAGDASDSKIEVFEDKAKEISGAYSDENQAQSYKAAFGNVLQEEVMHNLGGLHQDGGAVPPVTNYSTGRTSITDKERPASKNNYTKQNAAAIVKRIGKPLGTDKKTDKKEAELRDQTGTVGKVTEDEKKKKEQQ